MPIDVLCENDWVSLLSRDGYVFSHESRCNGNIVAVLPYIASPTPGQFSHVGVRREVTPAWGDDSAFSALTGGCDKPGVSPREIARIELHEEGGWWVEAERFEFLGRCRGTKSTDTIYHLYAVDVTAADRGEAAGDGTKHDAEGEVIMMTPPEVFAHAVDPIVFTMVGALTNYRLTAL